LQAYHPFVSIDYKPGRVNSVPDTLSRPGSLDYLSIYICRNDTKELEDIVVPDEYYIHTLRKIATTTFGSRPSLALAPVSPSPVAVQPLHSASTITTPYRDGALEPWEAPFLQLYSALPFVDSIKQAQDACRGLRDIRDYLEGNASSRGRGLAPAVKVHCEAHRKDWTVDAGLLRRIVRVPAVKSKRGETTRKAQVLTPIALPDESPLHAQIFRALHDHPTAAHIGEKKLAAIIRPRFYWKGWEKACQDYCRTCDLHVCQRYKALRRLKPKCVLPMHFPTPWHTVNIDLIGPLPTSRGMHYARGTMQ
jgi:hypothetical protein